MYSVAKSYQPVEEASLAATALAWLYWLEPLWVAVLAIPLTLPGLLPAASQPLAVVALLLLWPIHWGIARMAGQPFRLGQWSIGLVLLWLPVNLLAAVNSAAAWAATGYLLLGLVLYVIAINHPWLQQRPMRVWWLLLGLGGLLLVVAPPLVQWKSEFRLFYVPVYDWFQAIKLDWGETIHANILAGALVQVLALSVALALPPSVRTVHLPHSLAPEDDEQSAHKRLRIRRHPHERWQQWGAGALAGLTLGFLLLTQSRGAYLGAAVVVIGLVTWRWARLRYGLLLLAFWGAYSIYQWGVWPIFDLLGADNSFGGADWRGEVWYAAGQALHDFPYTGIGIGNFRTVLPLLYPNSAIVSAAANHAHNLFLQIGLDLGLPGLLAWLFIIGGALWQGISMLRRPLPVATFVHLPSQESHQRYQRRIVRAVRRYNENRALTAAAVAAISGLLVHGLLDAVTWGTKLACLPWLILALLELATTNDDS